MFYISSVGMTLVNLMSFYVSLKLFKDFFFFFLKEALVLTTKGEDFVPDFTH